MVVLVLDLGFTRSGWPDAWEVEGRKRSPEKDPWGPDLERPSAQEEALGIWKSSDGNGMCGWGGEHAAE